MAMTDLITPKRNFQSKNSIYGPDSRSNLMFSFKNDVAHTGNVRCRYCEAKGPPLMAVFVD